MRANLEREEWRGKGKVIQGGRSGGGGRHGERKEGRGGGGTGKGAKEIVRKEICSREEGGRGRKGQVKAEKEGNVFVVFCGDMGLRRRGVYLCATRDYCSSAVSPDAASTQRLVRRGKPVV